MRLALTLALVGTALLLGDEQHPAPRFTDPQRASKLEAAMPEVDRIFQRFAVAAGVDRIEHDQRAADSQREAKEKPVERAGKKFQASALLTLVPSFAAEVVPSILDIPNMEPTEPHGPERRIF